MVRYSRSNIMEDIEARLKLLREKRRLTQKELAEKQIAVPKMLKEPRKARRTTYARIFATTISATQRNSLSNLRIN